MSPTIVAFIGLFLGCLARVALPFLRKAKEAADAGQPIKFELRYLITAIFSVVIAVIEAMILFPTFNLPAESALVVAFLFGWANTDVLNEIVSTAKKTPAQIETSTDEDSKPPIDLDIDFLPENDPDLVYIKAVAADYIAKGGYDVMGQIVNKEWIVRKYYKIKEWRAKGTPLPPNFPGPPPEIPEGSQK